MTAKPFVAVPMAVAFAAMVPLAAAQADSAARGVRMFRSVEVSMIPESAQCGVKPADLARYKAHIMKHLGQIGLPQKQEAVVKFTSNVFARPFGALKEQCFVRVSLNMEATLAIDEATLIKQYDPAKGKQIKAILHELRSYPITAYNREIFYINPRAGVSHSVIEAIDVLFRDFKIDRKREN